MNNVTRLDSRRDAEAIESAKELRETEAWLHSERFCHITRVHTAYDAVAEIGKTSGAFLTLRNGAQSIVS